MGAFSNDFYGELLRLHIKLRGAYNEDGKGMGIWDAMTQEPGRIAHGENGNKSYRFSISWPRVLPEGTGRINEAGLTFYKNLVNELLDAGIEPMITLYHWNLPMALYEKAGFDHRKRNGLF